MTLIPGPPGPTRQDGSAGPAGKKGARGYKGFKGQDGLDGLAAKQGDKGDKSDMGDPAPQTLELNDSSDDEPESSGLRGYVATNSIRSTQGKFSDLISVPPTIPYRRFNHSIPYVSKALCDDDVA